VKVALIFVEVLLAGIMYQSCITEGDFALKSIADAGESDYGSGIEKPVDSSYIERGPISLEKLTIQDDIITYATKDERAHDFDA